jgi:hypothetical protein
VGLLELGVETLHIGEQLDGQVVAGLLDRGGGFDAIEECDRVRRVELLGDPDRDSRVSRHAGRPIDLVVTRARV